MNKSNKIIKMIQARIFNSNQDIRHAQNETEYERAVGAKYELEDLLKDISSMEFDELNNTYNTLDK